ncbi:hypothetical protein VP01_1637g1 [Puccinia sorghi]|uniref:Uncharacterized protein n=1 Tax=Puccinia sorghi TaxID=27349 RepID=A0A0L6VGV4_9BASI|nr:hypothetical protein VP01_1637g1 [Puccinia sorghi]
MAIWMNDVNLTQTKNPEITMLNPPKSPAFTFETCAEARNNCQTSTPASILTTPQDISASAGSTTPLGHTPTVLSKGLKSKNTYILLMSSRACQRGTSLAAQRVEMVLHTFSLSSTLTAFYHQSKISNHRHTRYQHLLGCPMPCPAISALEEFLNHCKFSPTNILLTYNISSFREESLSELQELHFPLPIEQQLKTGEIHLELTHVATDMIMFPGY